MNWGQYLKFFIISSRPYFVPLFVPNSKLPGRLWGRIPAHSLSHLMQIENPWPGVDRPGQIRNPIPLVKRNGVLGTEAFSILPVGREVILQNLPGPFQ